MKKLLFFIMLAFCSIISANCFAETGYDVGVCFDLELIFVRGSGAIENESAEYEAFAGASMKISQTYNLSTYASDLHYPAVGFSNVFQLFGAYVSAGKAYEFGNSVRVGVSNLKAKYESAHRECPDMHFVLVGYSQGAMVVSQAVSAFDPELVDFIMLLGDPNAYLPEGEGLFPSACYGGELSPWRTFVPNCRTHEGVFGARKPYEIPALIGKYSLWCNRTDYICGSSRNPLRNSGHTMYASSGEIDWGMTYLAKKYLKKKTADTERPEFRVRSTASKFDIGELIGVDDAPVSIGAPSEIVIERMGDTIHLQWSNVPDSAQYLLLRFNNYDLGYIDGGLGEFEIRDVDFSVSNEIKLAWMTSDGDLGDFVTRSVAELPVRDEQNDIVAIAVSEGSDEPRAIELVEASVAAEVAPRITFMAPLDRDSGAIGSIALAPQVDDSINRAVGFRRLSRDDILKILCGVTVAGSLIVLFVVRHRHG
jgi:hypothetical protein